MFEKVLKNPDLAEVARRLQPGRAVQLGGVWGSAVSLIAAALGRLSGRPVLLLARDSDQAEELADDMEVFSGAKADIFPAWEVDLAMDHVSDEVAGERLRLCSVLAPTAPGGDRPAFIVAPVMAMLQPVPSSAALAANRLTLGRGEVLAVERLIAWLVDAGFEQVEQVDQHGEFARRGGIVDIFPPGASLALRVEFFGDAIESIRRFDLDTNRSTEELEGVDLTGLIVGRTGDPAETTHLMAYLPAETVICMAQPGELREWAGEISRRCREMAQDGRAGAGQRLFEAGDLLLAMDPFAHVEMHSFRPTGREAVSLGIRSLQKLSPDAAEALAQLGELAGSADVWVYCENPAEENRFGQLQREAAPAGRIHTAIGHIRAGFHWPDEGLVVVGHHEIFHRYTRRRRLRRIRTGRPIQSLVDLQSGDYVVHVKHGIARFGGLRQLERDGRREEYLTLRFAGNAVLHVPVSQIHHVQKYVGARGLRATLSRLGGAGWQRQKRRVSEAVRDLAAEMLHTQAMRQSMPGVSYPARSDWQRQFAEEFLYSETEDQISAIGEIDTDMATARPMDRLLCGDVGFGKTELAMRAAFKVVEAGRQVAVLVPTTVLADQHWRTFTERLADYPMVVEVLSRFRSPSQQSDIVRRAAAGQVDILIGTHRLLSGDVRFADLGLVVIDEEQRFGVAHKEHLKETRASVDVLTMTATPIPRTLHLALLGLRDISSLATPPLDRRAIHTEVCHYDEQLIRRAILRELNRSGQIFFVHNRVMNIESVADRLRELVSEARVGVAHGQMKEHALEETMLKFVRQEIDVLVCTTIIESGLDIPTANTMIVHEADRFGLSELHQLRGRVGRYHHRAFCYLLLPRRRLMTPAAGKRLKSIEEFSDLGAGFQIAMRDLEIRGAGNILGKEQSGHIAVVGYELYCQLLERAVGKLTGTEPAARREVHVELGIDAYLPASYVPSDRQRMELYRRLAGCGSVAELEQLREELADAYGAAPEVAVALLDVAEARLRAGAAGIDSIIRMDPDLVFTVKDFAAAEQVFRGPLGTVRLPDDHTAHWRLPAACLEMPTLLRVLLKRLRQTAQPV